MLEYEDKSQDREERSSSVVSEATSKNTRDNEPEPEPVLVEICEPQQIEEKATSTTAPITSEEIPPPPMVQIDEDLLDVTQEEKRDSINYACAPPKKRLRIANSAYALDNYNYPEVKVSFWALF